MITLKPVSGPDPQPANLLPAGLADVTGMEDGRQPTVLYRDRATGDLLSVRVPGSDTAGQAVLPGLAETLTGWDGVTPVVLGPRSARSKARIEDRLLLPAQRASALIVDGARLPPPEVGIIDAGIAFWNPAFREDGCGSRFDSFGALNLVGEGAALLETLTADDIARLMTLPDGAVREELGQRFPASVFAERGRNPLFRADGLAHRTAMTDLVLSEADEAARLHGMELPVSVLRDLTGGQMAGIMDVALRAVVRQAFPETGTGGAMVVLMAFGFTGGPQDGSADILKGLEQALEDFAGRGIEVTLVLPVGNHLQDRVHAVVPARGQVAWRIQPDDFSANTLEIYHAPGGVASRMLLPDATAFNLPQTPFLGALDLNDKAIGGVWTVATEDGGLRTRITLSPTASRVAGDMSAPFGRWVLRAGETDLSVWILRDETGFEADPTAPARASWLEDDDYARTDALGNPALTDAVPSIVRRAGTASILATSLSDRILRISAHVGGHGPAPYASLPSPGPVPAFETVDLAEQKGASVALNMRPLGPGGQRAVLGNGGPARFRAAGTSLAAALAVGKRARGQGGARRNVL